ncbi:hypothetical protein E2C01_049498 [Portunus trituberculatus]|uniref:Uncharacterized protein n=1 Tax=Portunus trituberculatus TaxID=210409 RepID=A0A5B7GE17_PORTR|nr:hypothetical protein [Portunus trituberculatus]
MDPISHFNESDTTTSPPLPAHSLPARLSPSTTRVTGYFEPETKDTASRRREGLSGEVSWSTLETPSSLPVPPSSAPVLPAAKGGSTPPRLPPANNSVIMSELRVNAEETHYFLTPPDLAYRRPSRHDLSLPSLLLLSLLHLPGLLCFII